MPGEAAAIGAVATLLTNVFGWAVSPTGFEQLTLDNKLKVVMRGINEAIAKGDWASADALFGHHRQLLMEQGP